MQFFNFRNIETFHFFKWVSESGQVSPQDLVIAAISEAEAEPEDFEADDFRMAVREKLDRRLRRLIIETAPQADPDNGPEIGQVWNAPESLWLPILTDALGRIDCLAVSEALLIQAGKWKPSEE